MARSKLYAEALRERDSLARKVDALERELNGLAAFRVFVRDNNLESEFALWYAKQEGASQDVIETLERALGKKPAPTPSA